MRLLWLLRGNEGDGATAAAKLRGRAAAAAAESTAAAKLHGWGGTTAATAVGLLLLLPPDEELLLGEGAALAAYTAPAADMKDGGRVIWCLVPAIRPRRNGDRPAARRHGEEPQTVKGHTSPATQLGQMLGATSPSSQFDRRFIARALVHCGWRFVTCMAKQRPSGGAPHAGHHRPV